MDYMKILIVLKEHDGDVQSHVREFHILMWEYMNGRMSADNLRGQREIHCAGNVVDKHVHASPSAATH